MTTEQMNDCTLSLKEIKGAAEVLETMLGTGEMNPGVIATVRDILTRFAVPRLEAAATDG